MKKLILIGAGGHSLSVRGSLNWELQLAGYVDSDCEKTDFYGVPVIAKNLEDVRNKDEYVYHVAIGNVEVRGKYHRLLVELGLEEVNIIDDSAIIANDCSIGSGNYIGRNAVLDAGVVIGDCNIINTGAIVEHSSHVGDCSNISTGAILNGDVKFGNQSFAGSNCVINGQLEIGNNVVIGSGAVVTKDVEDNLTVVGVPARPIKRRELEE